MFLKSGKAYVPNSQEYSLVAAEFASRLAKALEVRLSWLCEPQRFLTSSRQLTAKALPRLDEDTRLVPILSHLSMGFMAGITSDYSFTSTADGEAVTADMVPELAVQSFPLCMRNMQDTLKGSKHLKHEGRMQYGLFLKVRVPNLRLFSRAIQLLIRINLRRTQGIGLSVEEALAFWRKSFSSITDDKFNKEYRYNIRHNYGLEGSRKNYTPKSCVFTQAPSLFTLTRLSLAAARPSSLAPSPARASRTVVRSGTTRSRRSRRCCTRRSGAR